MLQQLFQTKQSLMLLTITDERYVLHQLLLSHLKGFQQLKLVPSVQAAKQMDVFKSAVTVCMYV